jgi:hypothetical protein
MMRTFLPIQFLILAVTECYWSDPVKGGGIGGEYGMHVGEGKYLQGFDGET